MCTRDDTARLASPGRQETAMVHGAKWWKFDVHAHSPASRCWRGPPPATFTPADWLLSQMRAGLDCVAVTDHNSGDWIDDIKEAGERLAVEQPEGYRQLTVFPGVEISVNGGVHLLALFDPAESTQRITRVLCEIGFHGEFGETEACCDKPFHDVVAAVVQNGGVAIPAHVLDENGWFTVQGRPGQGPTLERSLASRGLLAIETTAPSSDTPELYRKSGLRLAEVVGSDSHRPGDAGRKSTWVKMEKPSISALQLALHDGADGILRGDAHPDDPNSLRDRLFVSGIVVKNAAKAGRGEPLEVRFSPWLTSIIGGRGAGKSSIVHFLRHALNKTSDLPEEARAEFESFRQVSGGRSKQGMFLPETEIRIELQRDDRRTALTRSASGWIEEEFSQDTNQWKVLGTPDRPEERIPIRIFSQKQLYELTGDSRALLNIVDESVGRSKLDESRRELEAAWLESRRAERALVSQTKELQNLLSERNDVLARIRAMEDSHNKETLATYQTKQQMQQGLLSRTKDFEDFAARAAADAAAAPEFKLRDDARAELGSGSATILEGLARKWSSAVTMLRSASEDLTRVADELRNALPALPWQADFEKAVLAYEALKKDGAMDPSTFDALVLKRTEVDAKILAAEAAAKRHDEQAKESERLRLAILAGERELRAKRRAVLKEWNEAVAEQGISASLEPLANVEEGEQSLRRLLRKDAEFGRVILEVDDDAKPKNGLLAGIANASTEEERWSQVDTVTATICAAGEGDAQGVDRKFAKYVQQLRQQTPEDLDRIRIWVPEDRLVLKLVKGGKESDIEAGSAGQRTAGMLALLMARGDGPIVIDQPEDDLDTRLISETVVPGLRALKKRQQVIVVTHNPNIPVNGAAEQIVEMHFQRGLVRRRCSGALQRHDVRSAVCEVMEGGREALDNRYYRISKALEHRLG